MPNANTEGYIAAMFEKAELRGASQWAQWFAECKRNGLNLVTLVVFGKISRFVIFASHFRTRAGLPKKSPACGLTQIGKIGLCSILAETTPTGSHTKLFTAEAFNLVLEIIKIGKNKRPKKSHLCAIKQNRQQPPNAQLFVVACLSGVVGGVHRRKFHVKTRP